MFTYLKDTHHQSKKKCEKYELLTRILKSMVTFVIIAITSVL